MPNWRSKEQIAIIKSMGSEVILVSKEQGGFLRSIRLSEQMKSEQRTSFIKTIPIREAYEHGKIIRTPLDEKYKLNNTRIKLLGLTVTIISPTSRAFL